MRSPRRKISRILLVRLDGIGDALACAPLVAALCDAGHELGGLFSTRNAEAFAHRAFARTHALERIPWPRHGSTPESRRNALAEVCAARYDVALIASEEIDAYAIARDARIPQRVGFVNGWEKPLKTLRVRPLLTRALVRPASAAHVREHEVETLFRLGAGLHDEAAPTRDPSRLRPLVLDAEPARSGRVVLQLTRKFARAGLDAAAFAALGRGLTAAGHEVESLTDDAAFANEFAAAGGGTWETPASLSAWKALLAGARAVVTPDSGAAHVAGMLAVPALVLFPAGPATAHDVTRWKPWLGRSRTLVASELAGDDGSRVRFAGRVGIELDALLAAEPAA